MGKQTKKKNNEQLWKTIFEVSAILNTIILSAQAITNRNIILEEHCLIMDATVIFPYIPNVHNSWKDLPVIFM